MIYIHITKQIMLAQINSAIAKNNGKYNFTFDIESIENILVFVNIEDQQYLHIRARNIERWIDEYDTESLNLYFEKILVGGVKTFTEVDLEKIIDILNNIKFNRLTGKFYLNNEDEENVTLEALYDREHFYTKLNSNIKVRKTYENCSVCFEPTMCKSKCDHYLCYPCWNTISEYFCKECQETDEKGCEDETCGHQRCPTCRQILVVMY